MGRGTLQLSLQGGSGGSGDSGRTDSQTESG